MGEVNPSILFHFTRFILVYLLFVVAIVVEFIFLNSTNFVWSNFVLFCICFICFAGKKMEKVFISKKLSSEPAHLASPSLSPGAAQLSPARTAEQARAPLSLTPCPRSSVNRYAPAHTDRWDPPIRTSSSPRRSRTPSMEENPAT